MSNELCPYCGDAPEIIPATVETWARCGNKDCYIGGVMMYLHVWNRRFVCYEKGGKDGKKMFVGDKVAVRFGPDEHRYICSVEANMTNGVLFIDDDTGVGWDWDDIGDCELIESESAT